MGNKVRYEVSVKVPPRPHRGEYVGGRGWGLAYMVFDTREAAEKALAEAEAGGAEDGYIMELAPGELSTSEMIANM